LLGFLKGHKMELNNIRSRMIDISKTSDPKSINVQKMHNIQADQAGLKIVGVKIKEEASEIKNINDIFGFLKKAEKTIDKIQTFEDLGNKNEALSLLETTYKDKNIFEELSKGKNLKQRLLNSISSGENVSNILSDVKFEVLEDLKKIKDQMLKKSQSMGSIAQKSFNSSNIKVDLSLLAKNTNVQYLKTQIKDLLS